MPTQMADMSSLMLIGYVCRSSVVEGYRKFVAEENGASVFDIERCDIFMVEPRLRKFPERQRVFAGVHQFAEYLSVFKQYIVSSIYILMLLPSDDVMICAPALFVAELLI
jgi:hypothetical protein